MSGRNWNTKQDLPETISFATGACVMVVQNIDTVLDLANGACGTIVDIVYAKPLHPDEPPIKGDQTVVNLKFLPLYILSSLTGRG